jgi:hypothetical protein
MAWYFRANIKEFTGISWIFFMYGMFGFGLGMFGSQPKVTTTNLSAFPAVSKYQLIVLS